MPSDRIAKRWSWLILALLVAPRPLPINDNAHDTFPPPAAEAALRGIEEVYLEHGASDALWFTTPPGSGEPHRTPARHRPGTALVP